MIFFLSIHLCFKHSGVTKLNAFAKVRMASRNSQTNPIDLSAKNESDVKEEEDMAVDPPAPKVQKMTPKVHLTRVDDPPGGDI